MADGVLICGGGPVGLTLAVELTRYGVPVRIIDKDEGRSTHSKALVVWSRTLELLDRADLGAIFHQNGMRAHGAKIFAEGKLLGEASFDGVDSPYPYGLMIPQSATERLLEEHLAGLGVRVERRTELTAFNAGAAGVDATLRHADGREERFDTAWLVGCDGAHSAVRHGLNMEFAGDTLASSWILADVHLNGPNAPEPLVVLYWHAEGLLVFFPIEKDRFRVVANLDVATDHDPTLEEVQAILDRRGPGGITAVDPVWMSHFKINERKVKAYRDGRVFLAGDAAHVHSPAGGQGMNTGMQDAFGLAWRLALVHHDLCPDDGPVLDSYSPERSAVGDQVLANVGALTRVGTVRNPLLQSLRNHVVPLVFGLSALRERAAEQMTEVSIGYPESPLNGHAGHSRHGPSAGARVAPRQGMAPYGAGDRPRFALCAPKGGEADAMIARHRALLEAEVRPPLGDSGLWIVRPDGYVAFAGAWDAWEEAGRYLDKLV